MITLGYMSCKFAEGPVLAVKIAIGVARPILAAEVVWGDQL